VETSNWFFSVTPVKNPEAQQVIRLSGEARSLPTTTRLSGQPKHQACPYTAQYVGDTAHVELPSTACAMSAVPTTMNEAISQP
jgi:hypothetical protein